MKKQPLRGPAPPRHERRRTFVALYKPAYTQLGGRFLEDFAIYYKFPNIQVQRDCSYTESRQLFHVTPHSIGAQPISEGKSWIQTNQICGIQKDRFCE